MNLILSSLLALTILQGGSALACEKCGCGEKGKACTEGKEKCDCLSCKHEKGESCDKKKDTTTKK